MKNIQDLLDSLNLKVKDVTLYERAFTHSSYNADAKTKHNDYEKLEFLGDSVLGCVVSELAYKSHTDMDQGSLTKLKSALVSTHALADTALELHFDEYIRVGNSFSAPIKNSKHLLEDVFEAFVGALFLDQGFTLTRKFIISTLYRDIQKFNLENLQDYKSKLQEAMQGEHRESVTYEVINTTGPAHNKRFTVRCIFDDMTIGVGEGATKKEAEQMAAKAALAKMAEK